MWPHTYKHTHTQTYVKVLWFLWPVTFFFLKISSIRVHYASNVEKECGRFYFLYAVFGSKRREDRDSWWLLPGRCALLPRCLVLRADWLSALRKDNTEPEWRVETKLCSLGGQDRMHLGGEWKQCPISSSDSAEGKKHCPERPSQWGEERCTNKEAATLWGQWKKELRNSLMAQYRKEGFSFWMPQNRLRKTRIFYSDLFMIAKERHVDFWFSGEVFLMMGFFIKR